jgi:hypothetical protein
VDSEGEGYVKSWVKIGFASFVDASVWGCIAFIDDSCSLAVIDTACSNGCRGSDDSCVDGGGCDGVGRCGVFALSRI